MRIAVELFGFLADYRPEGRKAFPLELEDGVCLVDPLDEENRSPVEKGMGGLAFFPGVN